MKISIRKKSKTILRFYSVNYGFRKPYQVLLDGTVCQAAVRSRLNIMEHFPKYLEGEAKFLSTQCVVIELEKLGNYMKTALAIIKQFGYHKCGHEKSPVSASECLRSMIGENNKSRYIVATQDLQLRIAARRVAGTPVMYIEGRSPVLEKPSHFSAKVAHSAGQAMFIPQPLPGAVQSEPEPEPKKRIKKSRPHPPPCKNQRPLIPKEKTASTPENPKKNTADIPAIPPKAEGEAKRKRKRIKLGKHLKEIKREWMEQAP